MPVNGPESTVNGREWVVNGRESTVDGREWAVKGRLRRCSISGGVSDREIPLRLMSFYLFR